MASMGLLTGALSAVMMWMSSSIQGATSNITSPETNYSCSSAAYTPRILSYYPLIIHLENFITPGEQQHLLNLANTRYSPSEVGLTTSFERTEHRTSHSASLPRSDDVVSCIIDRAADFQGFESAENIEELQATKYEDGQEYRAHYDWYGSPFDGMGDRLTTFFAILEANCTNCGTHFPRLGYQWAEENDSRLCTYVECGADSMIVRPLAGSAIFWRNLERDGSGNELTLHAGLPLTSGRKVGLNIWTRDKIPDEMRLLAQN